MLAKIIQDSCYKISAGKFSEVYNSEVTNLLNEKSFQNMH